MLRNITMKFALVVLVLLTLQLTAKSQSLQSSSISSTHSPTQTARSTTSYQRHRRSLAARRAYRRRQARRAAYRRRVARSYSHPVVPTTGRVSFKFAFSQDPKKEETVTVPISLIDKAKQAADEVAASRPLIAAQEAEITALKDRLALEQQKTSLLESIISAKNEQLVLKDTVINNLQLQNDTLKTRNAQLERSNKRWKKVGKVLGAVAAGFGLVLLH